MCVDVDDKLIAARRTALTVNAAARERGLHVTSIREI